VGFNLVTRGLGKLKERLRFGEDLWQDVVSQYEA
jgi:hypothetical protein